ncbi:MAG: aspartate/glutamate racemase family protein [Candidatus Wenzhouxiangella sp. M2_3B_020]
MKTIGLIGGMSWESTIPYYRVINEAVRERLGGLHSARIVLYSVDFHEIERLQAAGDWNRAGALLAGIAARLEAAGADVIVVCTNTMHAVAEAIESAVGIELLHIADATGEAVANAGLDRVGLLGTRFTMDEAFYRGRLEQRHGLDILVPNESDRADVHRVIFEELCVGEIRAESRRLYARVIGELAERGAEGIILGCTEIGLLIEPGDVAVPLFDTAAIHARAAAAFALRD